MRMFWSKIKSQENVTEQKDLSSENESKEEESLPEPAEDSTNYYTEENISEKKERLHKKSFFAGIMMGLLLALLIVSGVLLGREISLRITMQKAQNSKVTTEPASVANSRMISKVKTIEKLIDENFYLSKVDETTLENGVYSGMMTSLGDKYAKYYSAKDMKDLENENEGIYYGIGAYIGLDEKSDMPFISGVIEDAPAEKAGLRAGDIVYEVDGKSTYKMDLDKVVSLVKGSQGTKVKLSVVRDNKKIEVEVTRQKVSRPTATSKMLDSKIGYIQITEFDDNTVDQFTNAYAVIKGSNPSGLILDLRGNPGGLLSSVVSIAKEILPKGLIVYTKDKNGNQEVFKSDGNQTIKIPLVVLVDGGSASAAEILTGAIKDDKIGTIVGTQTYGKGIVQKLYPMSDGSAVKMTVSAYYTPAGINIQGKGITPDVTIKFDADAYYNSNKKDDNQLKKAEEILKEKIAGTYH